MKTFFLIVLVSLLTLANASAYLGWSEQQCIEHFGQPSLPDNHDGVLYFSKGLTDYAFTFAEGKCVSIKISQQNRKKPGPKLLLPDVTLKGFLKSNGDGSEWQEQPGFAPDRYWTTATGLTALYQKDGRVFMIGNREACAKLEAQKKAAEDAKQRLVLDDIAKNATLPTQITTLNGTKFTGVRLKSVDPDGIHIMHDGGAAKILMEHIPESLRAQFHFDEARGLAFRNEHDSAVRADIAKREELLVQQNHDHALHLAGMDSEHPSNRVSLTSAPPPSGGPSFSIADIKAQQKDLDGSVVRVTFTPSQNLRPEQQADGSYLVSADDGLITFPHDASQEAIVQTASGEEMTFWGLVRFGQPVLVLGTRYDPKRKAYTW